MPSVGVMLPDLSSPEALMPNITRAADEAIREQASRLGREEIDTHLLRFTPEQRDAFWHAIGLYYGSRRHPGAEATPSQAPAPVL